MDLLVWRDKFFIYENWKQVELNTLSKYNIINLINVGLNYYLNKNMVTKLICETTRQKKEKKNDSQLSSAKLKAWQHSSNSCTNANGSAVNK